MLTVKDSRLDQPVGGREDARSIRNSEIGGDVKLTPLAKVLITLVVLGAIGAAVYKERDKLFPGKKEAESSVPPKATAMSESSAIAVRRGATKATSHGRASDGRKR